MIYGDPSGLHSLSSIKKGWKPENIWVWEDDPTHFYAIKQIDAKINLVEDLVDSLTMDFYLTIGNPPFKGQLHLEFLKIALQTSKNVKLIHPSGWLTRSEKQIEQEVRNLLKNRLHKITIFNGNPVFSAQFQAPLVITEAKEYHNGPIEVYYTHTGNTYYLESLDMFPTGYWEPSEINYELRDLIQSEAKKSNLLSLRTSNPNSVPLNLPTICGHPVVNNEKKLFADDFYTFFYHNSNIYTHENNEGKFYSLNTKEERDSLVSYLKTKYARFALALNKATNRNNVSRYIENIPLPPLDRKWTDAAVMQYYGLNEQQKNQIDSFIPNYYSS